VRKRNWGGQKEGTRARKVKRPTKKEEKKKPGSPFDRDVGPGDRGGVPRHQERGKKKKISGGGKHQSPKRRERDRIEEDKKRLKSALEKKGATRKKLNE